MGFKSDYVGHQIRKLREGKNLTREALSEISGVPARTISDIETNISRAPRIDTIQDLAEALGVTEADLFAPPEKTNYSEAIDTIKDAVAKLVIEQNSQGTAQVEILKSENSRLREIIAKLTDDNKNLTQVQLELVALVKDLTPEQAQAAMEVLCGKTLKFHRKCNAS